MKGLKGLLSKRYYLFALIKHFMKSSRLKKYGNPTKCRVFYEPVKMVILRFTWTGKGCRKK